MSWYIVRLARRDDFDDIVEIEKDCILPGEAATKEQFEARYDRFQKHFYIIEYAGMVVGFVNGMVTDSDIVLDEMYKDASMHNEQGAYQTIFGLSIRKNYRGKGYARAIMDRFLEAAKKEGRKGVIVCCKKEMIPFFESLGFEYKSDSESDLCGLKWYNMCKEIKQKSKHVYTSKIHTEDNRI